MNLPKAEDVIRQRVNALLDQLGCGIGMRNRGVDVYVTEGDGVAFGKVTLRAWACIDVQSFQVLYEAPEGAPHAVEAG